MVPSDQVSQRTGSLDLIDSLVLHGVAHGGEAVGRAGDLVAFIGLGLPGERVRVEVTERKPRYLRGRVVEVLEPSPERATPPCPIFGTCGGCQWQHATYAAQLAFKTAVLRDQLARLGGFADPPLEPALASPLEWHYRNTVQLVPAVLAGGRPVAASRARGGTGRLLCFQRAHSNEPVPVEHCYIADELINRAIHRLPWPALPDDLWTALHEIVVRAVPKKALQVTLVSERSLARASLKAFVEAAREAMPELSGVLVARTRGGPPHLIWGEGSLWFRLGEARLEVPAGAFVQANLGVAAVLAGTIVEWLQPKRGDSVLDAYAGTGTFTIPLARQAGTVVAVEENRSAAEAAARNVADAGLVNVQVRGESVEQAFRTLAPREAGPAASFDYVVLDPPRKGCSPEALDGIVRLAPRRIVYVSCEPSTLARDLRRLAAAGYRLRRSRVADMFPQTYHLESISLLERA